MDTEKHIEVACSGMSRCPNTQQTPTLVGLQQYCNIYRKYKDLVKDGLLWGDETESIIVSINDESKTVTPLPIVPDVLRRLKIKSDQYGPLVFKATPECTEFQIETTPSLPFSGRLEDLGLVEDNMRKRRELIKRELPSDAHVLTLTSFPRFGRSPTNEQLSNTPNFDNSVICTIGTRYRDQMNNIKERAGEDYGVHIPVYQDRKTEPSVRNLTLTSYALALGGNALQITVETQHLQEARYLHDQLVVLCPIMAALTAGTPVLNGYLTETDSRLEPMSQSLDDRTRAERNPPVDKDDDIIHKQSRFAPVTWYISDEGVPNDDFGQDYSVPLYHKMIKEGMDKEMAKHGAILFSHPICEAIPSQMLVPESSDLLERIVDGVWPYVRFKPPTFDGTSGWRLEFRPMAIQPTDFENAAFAVFVLLLTRAIRHFSLNFIIPMSKVLDNYKRAITRDAVREKKLYFRSQNTSDAATFGTYSEMTVNDIVNGNSEFPGLIPFIKRYLDVKLQEPDVRGKVESYLLLISKVASGERPTVARRIRQFVMNHPEYRKDSVVSERIQYDLIKSYLTESLGDDRS